MFAITASEVGLLALSMFTLLLLILLGGWNVWLNARLREILRDSTQMREHVDVIRQSRSFEQELRDVVRLKVGDRFDAQSPTDLAALDESLKSRLPGLIRRELEQPSPELEAKYRQRIIRLADDRLDAILVTLTDDLAVGLKQRAQRLLDTRDESLWQPIDARLAERMAQFVDKLDFNRDEDLNGRIRRCLQSRVEMLFEDPESDVSSTLFEDVDARLSERISARLEEPGKECERELQLRIDAGLMQRLDTLVENADEHEDLFAEVDSKLGDHILTRAEEILSTSGDDLLRLDERIIPQIAGRINAIFDDPENHESLFESIDEHLSERILKLADRLPEETAERIDESILAGLVSEIEELFDAPENHEDLFESIDEALGKRITRLVDHPPAELKEKMDEEVNTGLVARVSGMFDDPDDYESMSDVDEQLGKRIERRLREELARGAEGLIDQTIYDSLKKRVGQRFDERSRREGLDMIIDTRITKATDNGAKEGKA